MSPRDAPSPTWLGDACGRRLDTLRLSVTDRCNLRCRYCMPPGGIAKTDRSRLLTWEESERLCALFARLGITRIRITGGEPLVRRGLPEFLGRLRDLGPELLLTTNGTRLLEHLDGIAKAGVRRLNVSLDSLRADTYRTITGRSDLDRVLEGLAAATAAGLGIKVNVVVLAGVNDREIPDFVELTRARDWSVRFIEPMPFDGARGRGLRACGIDGDRILEIMASRFDLRPSAAEIAGVAALYRVPGFLGMVGVIHAHSRRFCERCSRLRVSAHGQLRTCLYGAPVLDLRRMLREGRSDTRIAEEVRDAVRRRAADGHEAEAARMYDPLCSMARIGG